MATFIMMTRLAHGALKEPEGLEKLERQVADRIGTECPEVEWTGSYATLGPYDYLDIFEAPDIESATKVATIIRTFGHAHTETWAATEWKRFKEIAGSLLPLKKADPNFCLLRHRRRLRADSLWRRRGDEKGANLAQTRGRRGEVHART